MSKAEIGAALQLPPAIREPMMVFRSAKN